MPRRAQDGSRRRTRTGCQRCRLRKIKCDEFKPKCGQCLAKGFLCHTVPALKWEEDYLSRGLAFGRRGVWSRGPPRPEPRYCTSQDQDDITWCMIPSIRPYSFVNYTVKALGSGLTTLEKARDNYMSVPKDPISRIEGSSDAEGDNTTMNGPRSPISCVSQFINIGHDSGVYTISHQPRLLPELSSLRETLLTYYLQRLCPLTAASPKVPSPFASLILPYSITNSSAVLNSLMALSACHFAKTNGSFKTSALRLSDGVLGYLRGRLETVDARQAALDPEILVLTMILCLIEIVNECDMRWVVHLKGARELILVRRRTLPSMGSASSHPNNELVCFSERFFAYQDVIGRTACGEEPIFGGDFWANNAAGGTTDPWLGCSPDLISILCQITELSRQRAGHAVKINPEEFQLRSASLKHRLSRLEQKVHGIQDDILQTTAELKRVSASLYLECALRDAHPRLPRVRAAISQIFRLVSMLLEQNILVALAWPIFVAAVELDPLEDIIWATGKMPAAPRHGRPFVLYTLDRMSHSSVSNISHTRSVIEKVWQSRDVEMPSHEDHRRNDWERYVAPLCHGLSLG